jgi:hypothetical protein
LKFSWIIPNFIKFDGITKVRFFVTINFSNAGENPTTSGRTGPGCRGGRAQPAVPPPLWEVAGGRAPRPDPARDSFVNYGVNSSTCVVDLVLLQPGTLGTALGGGVVGLGRVWTTRQTFLTWARFLRTCWVTTRRQGRALAH